MKGRERKPWLLAPLVVAVTLCLLVGGPAVAQVTPAAGSTPPDDTPTVKVGGVIFADYTYQTDPEGEDAAGDPFRPNSFNLTRAYINVTGSLHHLFSFRITPDVTRETVTLKNPPPGTTLTVSTNGNYVVRLKYAYGQFNLDDWLPKGSWIRLGLQQTAYIDHADTIYRYRFQGTGFPDREGILSSADAGITARLAFPSNFGDVQFGWYNGEGYTQPETNDQKSFQARVTVRPAAKVPVAKGLRLTAFVNRDNFLRDGTRNTYIGAATFEHPWINLGAEWMSGKRWEDPSQPDGQKYFGGYSIWATPRLPLGFEFLVRVDRLRPDKNLGNDAWDGLPGAADAYPDPWRTRTILGFAYWAPVQKGVQMALLLDYERVLYEYAKSAVAPAKPEERRYALHTLLSF